LAGIIGKSALADELGVRAVSHKDSLLTTDDGQFQVTFETDSDDVELVCELNCNGGDSASLADCVSQSVDDRRTTLDVSLPAAGEYAVNVFARRTDDPTRLHHVHTYLVTSTQQASSQQHLTVLGTVNSSLRCHSVNQTSVFIATYTDNMPYRSFIISGGGRYCCSRHLFMCL